MQLNVEVQIQRYDDTNELTATKDINDDFLASN